MSKNLAERIENATAHISVGIAQSVSEPFIPILSTLEPLVKSEFFSRWLKEKKHDMQEVRHLVRTRANNLQKGLYLSGRVLGYVIYSALAYCSYQIIKNS